MPLDAIAAVVGAGAQVYGNHLTNKSNERIAQQTRDWQTSERLASQQFSERMWNMQNEYNSPAAQVQRFKDAGLNPALMYGSPQAAGNSSSAPQGSTAPGTSVPQMRSLFDGLNLSLLKAEIDNINADTEDKLKSAGQRGSDMKLNEQLVKYYKSQTDLTDKQAEYVVTQVSHLEKEMQKMDSEMELIQQQVATMSAQEQSLMLENYFKEQTMQDNIRKVSSELRITEAQAEYAQAYYCAQVLNMNADTALKNMQARLTKEEIQEVRGKVEQLVHQTEAIKHQGRYNAKEADYYEVKMGLDALGSILGGVSNFMRLITTKKPIPKPKKTSR